MRNKLNNSSAMLSENSKGGMKESQSGGDEQKRCCCFWGLDGTWLYYLGTLLILIYFDNKNILTISIVFIAASKNKYIYKIFPIEFQLHCFII